MRRIKNKVEDEHKDQNEVSYASSACEDVQKRFGNYGKGVFVDHFDEMRIAVVIERFQVAGSKIVGQYTDGIVVIARLCKEFLILEQCRGEG